MNSKLVFRAIPECSRWTTTGVKSFSSMTRTRTAYIALGSNDGNTIQNIETACRELDNAGLRVLRTSHLYDTKPMYYHEQSNFTNGACEVKVEDNLSPLELLAKLKEIERSMGRKKLIEKGPRNIDLDILLYGDQTWESQELSIPHKSMLEREFVLRPLCDLISSQRHPRGGYQTYGNHLDEIASNVSTMSTITAMGNNGYIKALDSARKTQIMSILNVTPDSFSDGGKHSLDPSQTLPTIKESIINGASIIDIGGYSTRPGAAVVSVNEETERVIPMVQALHRHRSELPDFKISIDTFRHEVAHEAIKSGADLVNDISAGIEDPKMLSTVAKLGCTYIAMHMRGNPQTMATLNKYENGVVQGVATELIERLKAAEDAGIRKWRIILDPGIGFAKNGTQNLEILRNFSSLRNWPGLRGFPWLVGTSRKQFIGRITKVDKADERVWGTAAAVTASIQAGTDIVRVHDVKEMSQVARFADAIWRQGTQSES